jgi:hypothetical protein
VNSIVGDGSLAVGMDTPRDFRRLAIRFDAVASGPRLPHAVRLSVAAAAARGPVGETYSASLSGETRQLASVQAAYPDARRRVSGTWKLDLGDDDLTPFTLGRPLPIFNGVGEGGFETDPSFSETHVRGTLKLSADHLAVLRPQLAGMGAVRLSADFDLTRGGSRLRIDRLQATLAGAKPYLTVTGLQAFAVDTANRGLTVADPTRDLFGVSLQEAPLEWAQPFLRGITLTGGVLRGSLVAGARDGGVSLRSSSPLAVAGLSATREGQALLQDVGITLSAALNYTPQGWEVDVKGRVLSRAGRSAVSPVAGEARLGRLAGANQPVKLTGRVTIDLPSTFAQPGLVRGDLDCAFDASIGAECALGARVVVSDLALEDAVLPGITADVRADLGPAGRVTFKAPLLIDQDGRQSDLTVSGTATVNPAGIDIDGQLSGGKVFLSDTAFLSALLLRGGSGTLSPPSAEPGRFAGPAPVGGRSWSRITGRLGLSLRDVTALRFEATDVTGQLTLSPGRLSFEGLHVDLGRSGDARIGGFLAFDGAAAEPWALSADVSIGNFDPSSAFSALYPTRMPTVEGKFNITGSVAGCGRTPIEAALNTRGDLHFVSNGGVLRLLSTDIASKGASARRVAIIGSLIGDLTGVVTGRKDLGQAITRAAGTLSAIPYDQMSFVLSRDPSLDTSLRDCTLISPEIRLVGGGRVTYAEGVPLLKQALAAAFKLGARGRTADVFRLAGLLGTHPDDLGYFAFTEPLKIGGTLGRPDTTELQAALLKDIAGRSGSSDLIDRLLGK